MAANLSSVVFPTYKGYTKFAIWPADQISSDYGLISKESIISPVPTGEVVTLPYYAGHLYAAYQPQDDLCDVRLIV